LDIVPLSKKFRKYAEALYKILFEHFYRLGVSACVSVAVSLDIKGQDWDPVANESEEETMRSVRGIEHTLVKCPTIAASGERYRRGRVVRFKW
jgi:hypothetical protein